MLPALVAGCVALAERRPRRVTLAGLAVLHVAVLALALPLVVPILPTAQLVSTGTWDRSFWKDELGWHELVAQTATAWHSRTPAERASAAIVAGNYGVAGALSLSAGSGPADAGLRAPPFQYWHPAKMPQRTVLLVGFDRGDALRAARAHGAGRGRQPLARGQRGARQADRLVPAASATRTGVAELVRDRAAVVGAPKREQRRPAPGKRDADVLMRPEALAQKHDADDRAERQNCPATTAATLTGPRKAAYATPRKPRRRGRRTRAGARSRRARSGRRRRRTRTDRSARALRRPAPTTETGPRSSAAA